MSVLNKNSTSLAGEFAVLSQLSLRGFDANMTLGHTKGVDILASDPEQNRLLRVEVKTRFQQPIIGSRFFGNNLEWHMSKKHEELVDPSLFYCFVDISGENNAFRYFILPSEIVARYVREQHRAYLKEHPNNKDTDLRIFRLTVDDRPTRFRGLEAEAFEDGWKFKI